MSGDFTFLKGNVETIILCALYNKDMYGYELAKSIKERSENKYEIKQPTLYAYLKRLEQDGYVYSYWGGESSGGRRRYYKLTDKGRKDCEKFIAEWEYQRNVMGSLVDGTAQVDSVTQGDATAMFGRKSPRKRNAKTFDEQDDIARKLQALSPDVVEEPQEEPIEQAIEPPVQTVEPTPQVTYQQPTPTVAPDPTAKFVINQDDADSFMQDFDQLAMQASQKQASGSQEPPEGENYQHTLLNIIGDQLDEVEQDTMGIVATTAHFDATAELEEVADNLAREGIRLRIYNHATANFKSKTLIPHSKVIRQASWLTYGFEALILCLIAISSISVGNWLPPLIALGVLILLPLGATLYSLANPTRTDKPNFNFKMFLMGASIITAIVILAAIGISVFNNIELSNYVAVVNQILLPSAISLLLPAYVLIYHQLYKKY